MKKFCIECGKEATLEHKVCIYCGTAIPDIEADQPVGDGADEAEEVDAADLMDEQASEVDQTWNGQAVDEVTATTEAVDPSDLEASVEDSTEADAEFDAGQAGATTADPSEVSPEAMATAGAEAQPAETDPVAGATGQEDRSETKSGKGKKILFRMGLVLAILLIGVLVWAKNYMSPEAVEKRFEKAVEREDAEQLKKLIVHGDLSSLEDFEVEAFLKLVKHEGRHVVSSLTDTVYAGKFLYVFDAYKVEVQDQIPYGDKLDDLSYTFNGKEVAIFDEDEDEEYIVFGPLAPGIYTVSVNFSSDFGELSVEEEVTLAETSYQEYTYMGIDIPLAKVSVYVENADYLGHENIKVKIGEKEFSIDEYGETGSIGTVLVDGSVMAQAVATLPWGEVVSQEVPIEDGEPWITAEFLSDSHLKDLKQMITDFGEQIVEARAAYSTKPIKNASKETKEFIERYFYDFSVYTGQLNRVGIDENGIYLVMDDDQLDVVIPVHYEMSEDVHDQEDKPDISDQTYIYELTFSYKKDDKAWTIKDINPHGWSYEMTDEWDGSGKTHGPDEDLVKEASSQGFEKEMESFLKEYTEASVEAINERDFSIVSDYITKDGPRREEAEDYIDYLDSKDIYETWIGTELEKVEELGKKEWEVTVKEEFEIIRPDSDDQWQFRTVLIVKEVDGDLLVDELISTDRLD